MDSAKNLHLNHEARQKVPSREHMTSAPSDDVSTQITAAIPLPEPDTVGPSCEIRHLVHLRVKVRRRKAISGYPELPDMS